MKKKRVVFLSVVFISIFLASGCVRKSGPKDQAPPAETVTEKAEEVGTQDIAAKNGFPGPSEDYYEYINHQVLEEKQIPADSNSWSYLYELSQNAYEALNEVLEETVKQRESYEKGSVEQKISDLYLTAADLEGREKAGFGMLEPYLDGIRDAAGIPEYLKAIARINRDLGLGSLLPVVYYEDMTDSDLYACYLYGPDLGLGKETLEDETQKEVVLKYQNYVQGILEFSGLDTETAAQKAGQILSLQKSLASLSLSLADRGNPDKIYNKRSMEELKGLFTNVDMEAFLSEAGAGGWEYYVVADLKAAEGLNEYLTEENLPLLKDYSVFCLISTMGDYLSPEIRNLSMDWNNSLKGIEERKSEEKLTGELTQGMLGFEFGRLYVEQCFSKEDKLAVEDMARQIMDHYKTRIKALDWMGDETKAQAVKKLDQMTLKIGYPDQWPDYYGKAAIRSREEGGCLIDNMLSLLKARQDFQAERIKKPVDRGEWAMTPQTVNAYYNPLNNEVVFPAAILQAPYYDSDADYAANLGGIGMVIAHEISHAFDSTGSLYDEKGNYHLWWTDEDRSRFEELAQKVIEYYDGQEGFDGRTVNGSQTLNENIADLASLSCVTSIAGEDADDLTLLFKQYAAIWASKYTDESMIQRLNTDVHSPAKVRVNAVLSATDQFYRVYPEIKEGDPMFVAPEKRVKIY